MENTKIYWLGSNKQAIDITLMSSERIQNTILLLHKKQQQWKLIEQDAFSKGYTITPILIQDKPVQNWLEIFYKELHERAQKQIEFALTILKRTNTYNNLYDKGRS